MSVLDHFERMLNGRIVTDDAGAKKVRIMLLAGGDLIQSFAVPNVWTAFDLDRILGEFGCKLCVRALV